MERGRVDRTTSFVAVVLFAWLFLHTFAIWLYLTPTNPLKISLWGPVDTYVNPIFSQNWQLFAPTPINRDELLVVKVRWVPKEETTVWETAWIDITSPVYNKLQRSRIGPFSKLARPYTGLREMLTFNDPILAAVRKEQMEHVIAQLEIDGASRGDSTNRRIETGRIMSLLDSLSQPSNEEMVQRKAARRFVYRLAAAHAKAFLPPGARIRTINVKYIFNEFPRFSQRYQPSGAGKKFTSVPLGWEPIPPDVYSLPRAPARMQ